MEGQKNFKKIKKKSIKHLIWLKKNIFLLEKENL